MLVIRRQAGEGVRIGDAVVVKVLSIGRNRIKLGIEAPTDLAIARDDLVSPDDRHANIERTSEVR